MINTRPYEYVPTQYAADVFTFHIQISIFSVLIQKNKNTISCFQFKNAHFGYTTSMRIQNTQAYQVCPLNTPLYVCIQYIRYKCIYQK